MNSNDLRMLAVDALHAHERTDYDQEPVPGSDLSFLNRELLSSYLDTCRVRRRRLRNHDDESILKLTGIITDEGELTVAGLYALGEFPQGKLPAISVTAAVTVSDDGSGVRTRNLQHFDGPLPALLEDVTAWIASNSSVHHRYRPDGHMVREPEFPTRAIREFVANALVHRDLEPDSVGVGKRVEVRLSDDRLIIMNPGGLRGVTVAQLRSNDLAKAAVNQRVYEIAKLITTENGVSLIEGEGGGIREVFTSVRNADLPTPRLFDKGVRFTALLARGSVFSEAERAWLTETLSRSELTELTHIQKAVLLGIHNGGTWSIPRLMREFSPLTRSEAQSQWDDLVRRGLVENSAGLATSPPARQNAPASTKLDPADLSRMHALGKNTGAIAQAIATNSPASLLTVVQSRGLSEGQVRYALNTLIDANAVAMVGGQGSRKTTYQLLP